MRNLLQRSLWIVLISCLYSYSAAAQNANMLNNNLYKNVVKYYEQAETLYTQGNTKDALKRLQYADQFAQKLVKAGHESEIQDYLKKIQDMQRKLDANASPSSTKISDLASPISSSSGAQMSRTEWRAAVDEINQLESQIRNLFNFLPAYANLNETYKTTVETLQGAETKNNILNLKKQEQARLAYHKLYVKRLDRVLGYINDLDGVLASSNFSKNIEATSQYLQSGGRGQADFIINNSNQYLDLLSKILPSNTQIEKARKSIQIASEKLQQKEAAEAKTAAKARSQDRSLPLRGLKDATLEKEFKSLAQSSVPSPYQIIDVIITSSR